MLEKIAKSKRLSYLKKNNLISKNQFGFQLGKSTTRALYEAAKFMYNEFDNNQKVLAVFLDLEKYFYTVNNILINILSGLGIKNESLNWFISYLKNRKQMVSINGVLSNENKLTYGSLKVVF